MSSKAGYIAVPLEEPVQGSEFKTAYWLRNQQLPAYSKEFQAPYVLVGTTQRGCCHQNSLSYFMFNDFEGFIPDHKPVDVGTPLFISHYDAPVPPMPKEPLCDPTYKWNGPHEILIDPQDVSGLIFSIKGLSSQGSVVVRQDPYAKDYINVTNKIYLSDENLQDAVDIKIDIIDDDYTITIETPSFEGPRLTQKCVFIDTIITLPVQVNFFRSILVDVPNSQILTEGLENVDFAYVGLKTRNGHIKAEDVNFAIGEVSTVNGHVKGSYVVAENLDVRTINGVITINAIANSWAEDISISAKSINGHLNINVEDLTEDQDLNLRAGSVNGGIITTLPDSYIGNFTVTTLVGYAYVEGKDITYYKNLRNHKAGFKEKKYKNHHEKSKSSVILEAVTGAVELYFV
ncbi:15597_t:CDS:10 [Gigaspora margarita]|uniref:15597_t:CDS:1 n=1 Tax=Gigaspora margarita TaxID=4874 RepID=A0ABN7V4U5_GIGMA|nr:15597_t:CDS:10 [Gigaspora margarita]